MHPQESEFPLGEGTPSQPWGDFEGFLLAPECLKALPDLEERALLYPLIEDHLRGLILLCSLLHGETSTALKQAEILAYLYGANPILRSTSRFLLSLSRCAVPEELPPPRIRRLLSSRIPAFLKEQLCPPVREFLLVKAPDLFERSSLKESALPEEERWRQLQHLYEAGFKGLAFTLAQEWGFTDRFRELTKPQELFLVRLSLELRRDGEALAWIPLLLRKKELTQEERGELMLQLGRVLLRTGRDKEAEHLYRRALKLPLPHETHQAITYRLGLLKEGKSALEEARNYYRRGLTLPPRSKEEEERVVRLGLVLLRLGERKEAEELFARSLSASATGLSPRFLYLEGRLGGKERLSRNCGTIERIAPLSYYRFLCLQLFSPSPLSFSSFPSSPVLPRRAKPLLLEELGLYENALWEWEDEARSLTQPEELAALSIHLSELGYARKAIQILAQHLDLSPWLRGERMEKELWQALYPLPFQPWVFEAAQRYALDPYLIYGVMRQESRFDPRATSPAQARGLLQLLWDTARNLLAPEEDELQSPEDLHHPQRNIELGSRYLRKLWDLYEGELFLVLAAYNAGTRRVEEWRRVSLPLDLWVEQIPFPETRDYVKKVLENYYRYLLLYATLPEKPLLRITF